MNPKHGDYGVSRWTCFVIISAEIWVAWHVYHQVLIAIFNFVWKSESLVGRYHHLPWNTRSINASSTVVHWHIIHTDIIIWCFLWFYIANFHLHIFHRHRAAACYFMRDERATTVRINWVSLGIGRSTSTYDSHTSARNQFIFAATIRCSVGDKIKR